MDFTASFDTTDADVVIRFAGELDIASEQHARSVINNAFSHGSTVVFDLSDLKFCDSTGLSVFLAAHKRAVRDGGSVTLRNAQPNVERVIAISGMSRMFREGD